MIAYHIIPTCNLKDIYLHKCYMYVATYRFLVTKSFSTFFVYQSSIIHFCNYVIIFSDTVALTVNHTNISFIGFIIKSMFWFTFLVKMWNENLKGGQRVLKVTWSSELPLHCWYIADTAWNSINQSWSSETLHDPLKGLFIAYQLIRSWIIKKILKLEVPLR